MIFAALHSFANIFADGYSDVKTYLFFIYFLLLVSVYVIFKNFKTRKINWKYFGLSLFGLYFYSLVLHFFYIFKHQIPIMRPFVTGFNAEMSYSALWHMQISKGFIGILIPHLDNIDAGLAYLGSFPAWVFLIGSFLLFSVLLQTIVYFLTSFRDILKNKKNNRQIIFLIFAYSVLSFSLIKTSIDGGMFHPAFITGFIFILFFIFRHKWKSKKYYYITTSIGVIFMLISIYTNYLVYGTGWAYIQIATLILFYQLILYGTEDKIKITKLLFFVALFLTSWWLNAYRDLGLYKYSQINLPLDRNVYYYDKNDLEVKIYSEDKVNKRINDLAIEFNKNIHYLPITVSGKTCQEVLPYRNIALTLLSDEPIKKNQFPGSNMLRIFNKESLKKGDKWETSFIFNRASCLPESFSVIHGELLKNGISSYTYYNFSGF